MYMIRQQGYYAAQSPYPHPPKNALYFIMILLFLVHIIFVIYVNSTEI